MLGNEQGRCLFYIFIFRYEFTYLLFMFAKQREAGMSDNEDVEIADGLPLNSLFSFIKYLILAHLTKYGKNSSVLKLFC